MDAGTRAALNRINRDFYDRHAAEFSARRERPWPGWERVVAALAPPSESEARDSSGSRSSPGGPRSAAGDGLSAGAPAPRQPAHPAVLDVGCGNARFGVFLAERLGGSFDYLGVDASAPLLELAEGRLAAAPGGGERSLLRLDLTAEELGPLLGGRRFDLIAVFGLLHHLPGLDGRAALLGELAGLLEPDGLLALAFWQFAGVERFRRRMVPWEESAARTGVEVAPERLEPGDHLLAWGTGGAVRYCHHADDAEAGELVEALPLEPVATWRAEDGLNLYHLLHGDRWEIR